MILPPDHPARTELNNEVHARPPEALTAPCAISYLALITGEAAREKSWHELCELARRFGAAPPEEGQNHFSAVLGAFRVKWERHSEFIRYKFIVDAPEGEPFSAAAIEKVPQDWLQSLSGRVLVATNVFFERGERALPDADAISKNFFSGNPLVGATVAGGSGRAYTAFRIGSDGFGRVLVQNLALTPRQAGRTVQRLMEIDTYRMLSLLALPAARALSPFLGSCERELVEITGSMAGAKAAEETALLERLMTLEASIEAQKSNTQYRFSAASAYYELVQRRIGELREQRIEGLQTISEFMGRRLEPAMNTCAAAAGRLQTLSSSVANATRLLSTKADIAREQQNQAVLASMNRRAKVQLRLQQTVEGLSLAAVTYYTAGLVAYVAKAAKAAGVHVDPDIAAGISIPFIAAMIAYGIHRVRKSVAARE
jgi:uncharacterized membrane-anchored protein